MRRKTILAGVVGVAAVAAVSAGSLAWADSVNTYTRNSGASAEWSVEDGTFTVCDMAEDGAGAFGTVAVWHDGKGDYVTRLQLTDPDPSDGCVSQEFDLEPGTRIQVNVMLVKDGAYTDLKSNEGEA